MNARVRGDTLMEDVASIAEMSLPGSGKPEWVLTNDTIAHDNKQPLAKQWWGFLVPRAIAGPIAYPIIGADRSSLMRVQLHSGATSMIPYHQNKEGETKS